MQKQQQQKSKAGGIFTHSSLFNFSLSGCNSNTMAVDTFCEDQHTISPRLNKQYTTVVNLGTITVWYDGLKERLSEHADHIKTLGQEPPQ